MSTLTMIASLQRLTDRGAPHLAQVRTDLLAGCREG
jgi:hypothetical protein